MQNIKIGILSILVISTILIIGIKSSSALYNKNNVKESDLTLSFESTSSFSIDIFNKDSSYDLYFSLINNSNKIKKYSIVWADVINNINNPNGVLYSVSKCNSTYDNCQVIDEDILPATTYNTIAAIPSLNNLYIDINNVNYYKISIKANNTTNNSFKGSIKLVNIEV